MATDHLVDRPALAGRVAAAPSRSTLAQRLPSLTGLRFPAALAVFAYHATLPIPSLRLIADNGTAFDLAKYAGQAGGLGVTFFFVLSGFVLTWSARDNDSAPGFWRRRLVKIYPNYLVAWVLAMAVFAAAYTPTRTAIENLLMLQVWTPDFFTNFSVDPPSWSLGAEAVFYLAFPFLLRGARCIAPAHLKYWIAGVVAAVVATPALAYALLPSSPGVPGGLQSSVTQYWVTYVLPPVRMADFALGILVALAVRAGRWRNIGIVWSALLLAAGYALTFYVPYLYGQRATMIVPVALLIAAAAIADRDGHFSPFRNRAMVWLGNVSFAFYLLHFVVLATLRKELGGRMFGTAESLALIAGAAGAAVLLSWALYALVESPLTRRFSVARRRSRSSVSAR